MGASHTRDVPEMGDVSLSPLNILLIWPEGDLSITHLQVWQTHSCLWMRLEVPVPEVDLGIMCQPDICVQCMKSLWPAWRGLTVKTKGWRLLQYLAEIWSKCGYHPLYLIITKVYKDTWLTYDEAKGACIDLESNTAALILGSIKCVLYSTSLLRFPTLLFSKIILAGIFLWMIFPKLVSQRGWATWALLILPFWVSDWLAS